MRAVKYLFLFSFLITGLYGFGQAPSISWSVTSQKLDGQNYLIRIRAVIAKGWYIYARTDSALQISQPEISWDNNLILKWGEWQKISNPAFIRDAVFNKSIFVYKDSARLDQRIEVRGIIPSDFKINIHGFASNGKAFLPMDEPRTVPLAGGLDLKAKLTSQIRLSTVNLDQPAALCGEHQKKSKGILALFILGMAGGLIALLTPCVFPMIPVTVSFFTGRAKTKRQGMKNGILYGSSILFIYLLASLPFHLLGNINPEIFNSISTNVWVNLAFFAIFITFALSFFGLFEITIPSGIINKTDSKSGAGSFVGIFFMALTLATVSFSCTGPILGSLLVGSLSGTGGAWQLTAGMGGFGLALALPFSLFAMFPGWMKRLPNSGGWLDAVKKVLAFIELGLAFKFLSNADLVMHWGILKREIFIGIWILISAGLALYLFGAFQKNSNISLGRKVSGALMVLFTSYLFTGLTGSKYANLKLLSGFPPPLSYSIYAKENSDDGRLKPNVINDFEKAIQLSRMEHKPILIDFTGWACVNCRKMEEQIWTSPEIKNLIRDKFILVSLYVDDRKKLPFSERFTYKEGSGNEKDIVTVGDRWATFESENFKQVSQPLYVILNSDEQLMNLPVGYTPDAARYRQWLQCGLEADLKTTKN